MNMGLNRRPVLIVPAANTVTCLDVREIAHIHTQFARSALAGARPIGSLVWHGWSSDR